MFLFKDVQHPNTWNGKILPKKPPGAMRGKGLDLVSDLVGRGGVHVGEGRHARSGRICP
jgi:hypothetical protein